MTTETGRMHLVARLEHLFNEAIPRLTGGTVLAYYGLNGAAQPPGIPESILVGKSRWKVEWRDTNNISGEISDCGVCPHQQPFGEGQTNHGAPFWRGSGDDIVIQHMIEKCCPGRKDSRLQTDELGRIAFNSFRVVIFRCVNDPSTDHSFMLAPVIPHEGDELSKRIRTTEHLIRFLHEKIGLKEVRVCVLKGARKSWLNHSRTSDNYTRQAEILRTNVRDLLRRREFGGTVVFAEESGSADLGFEIERAIAWADLIVPFDGSTGNLIARILTNVSGHTKLYAIPWFKKDQLWPIGEGAFIGYAWPDPALPIQRAAMWKTLENLP